MIDECHLQPIVVERRIAKLGINDLRKNGGSICRNSNEPG